jgi:hypothetical protein
MPERPEKVHQPATGGMTADAVFGAALADLERVLGETMAPGLVQSRAAFRRDLPLLLEKHPEKWVAYSGEQQLGIGATKTQLYQDCLRRGLMRGQFLVLRIEPEIAEETELPLDV